MKNKLAPGEVTELLKMCAQLKTGGYIPIKEHGQLRPGVRVCHRGQQWADAQIDGTGVVLVLTQRPDSSWSRSWGAADIELVALWDEPRFGSRLSQLAHYHVLVAANQSQEAIDWTDQWSDTP